MSVKGAVENYLKWVIISSGIKTKAEMMKMTKKLCLHEGKYASLQAIEVSLVLHDQKKILVPTIND